MKTTTMNHLDTALDGLVWLAMLCIGLLAALLQLDWNGELARILHALTEPTAVTAIVGTLGYVIRTRYYKKRIRAEYEGEIAELKRQVRELQERRHADDEN